MFYETVRPRQRTPKSHRRSSVGHIYTAKIDKSQRRSVGKFTNPVNPINLIETPINRLSMTGMIYSNTSKRKFMETGKQSRKTQNQIKFLEILEEKSNALTDIKKEIYSNSLYDYQQEKQKLKQRKSVCNHTDINNDEGGVRSRVKRPVKMMKAQQKRSEKENNDQSHKQSRRKNHPEPRQSRKVLENEGSKILEAKTDHKAEGLIFAEALKQQIKRDRQVSHIKHHITAANLEEVWKQFQLHDKIGKQQLILHTEEYDPFYIEQEIHQLSDLQISILLTQRLTKSQQHWEKTLSKSFSGSYVTTLFNRIAGEKQELTLRQVVREFGIVLGTSLKNRDMYCFYQRMGPFTKENMVQLLSRDRESITQIR